MSGKGRETFEEVRDGSGNLPEVRDGTGDPLRGQGRVKGPLGRSATGRGTLPELWDGLEDTFGGPGRVGEHF